MAGSVATQLKQFNVSSIPPPDCWLTVQSRSLLVEGQVASRCCGLPLLWPADMACHRPLTAPGHRLLWLPVGLTRTALAQRGPHVEFMSTVNSTTTGGKDSGMTTVRHFLCLVCFTAFLR